MHQRRLFAIALFLIMAFSISVPVMRADGSDQNTKLRFSESVEIPGRTLPAGTYWFVLVDDNAFRNVVQIFSAVSYTHLDVYKRQVEIREDPWGSRISSTAPRGSHDS